MVHSQPDNESINSLPNLTQNISGQHTDAWFVSKGIHICHLNVHYLYPTLDEIKFLLHEQKSMVIFCLGETFLNDQYFDSELTIPNYNFIRKDRQSNGGGSIIYYKTDLACIRLVDLEINNRDIMWLEVRNNRFFLSRVRNLYPYVKNSCRPISYLLTCKMYAQNL